MKLLMTADTVGGVWTYAIELCRALSAYDVEIVLATMGRKPSAAQVEEIRQLANVHLHPSSYKLEWMESPWTDVERAGEWLLALALRERVDLVHLNNYAHASLPWNVPVLVVAHSCVCSWWRAVHVEEAPHEWDDYRARVRDGLRAAQLVVAPTQAFRACLESTYRFSTPTAVVHNGRTADGFSSLPARPRLPIVFACGRLWDKAKNFRALDTAARHMPWKTYVAGDTLSPDGESIEFRGARPLGSLSSTDLAAWLKRVAIFAHPALYEPFGLAVLEAALAGCALVLNDLPELRELWQGAAEFTDARDPHALHSTLAALIADPDRRDELGHAARARAAGYGPQPMAAAYANHYGRLIAARQQNAA